jgi:cytochrome c-type biogenesis protein CcmH/NrfG
MQKKILIFTIVILLLAVAALAAVLQKQYQRIETLQACDQDRYSDQAYKHCGELENKYNIEYLCTSLEVNAYCWTEVK